MYISLEKKNKIKTNVIMVKYNGLYFQGLYIGSG